MITKLTEGINYTFETKDDTYDVFANSPKEAISKFNTSHRGQKVTALYDESDIHYCPETGKELEEGIFGKKSNKSKVSTFKVIDGKNKNTIKGGFKTKDDAYGWIEDTKEPEEYSLYKVVEESLGEGFQGRDWSVKRVTFEVAVKDKDLGKFSGSSVGAGRGLFGSLGKVLEDNGMILMGDLLDVEDADTKAYIDNEMISDEDFEGLGESTKLTESADDFFANTRKIIDMIEDLEVPLDVGVIDGAVDEFIKIQGALRAQILGTKNVLSDMKKEIGADAGDDIDDVISTLDNLF